MYVSDYLWGSDREFRVSIDSVWCFKGTLREIETPCEGHVDMNTHSPEYPLEVE
jgi:hypothetical protein